MADRSHHSAPIEANHEGCCAGYVGGPPSVMHRASTVDPVCSVAVDPQANLRMCFGDNILIVNPGAHAFGVDSQPPANSARFKHNNCLG